MTDSSWRDSFIPIDGAYLLNHSVGRPPRHTAQAWQDSFLTPWEQQAEQVWPQWLGAIEGFRTALADLLQAPASNFCPQVNLSSGLHKVLNALPMREKRNTLVYTATDFPSMGFVLQQAEKQGYKLRQMPADADVTALDSWRDVLDADVAFALVTHVHSNTGQRVPVGDICALCAELGICSVVDIAQSVGSVPISLSDWQPDIVLGSCVKWLCGGPGAGFLYVSNSLLPQCQPQDVGWFSHEDPFEFDIHHFRYAEDALRFWGGTPSVQPYAIAANSIRHLLAIGIDTVREHSLTLAESLLSQLPGEAINCPRDSQKRGGTVVLQFGSQQAHFETLLRQQEIWFDSRATGVRLSPHIYNTANEIDQLLHCVQQL